MYAELRVCGIRVKTVLLCLTVFEELGRNLFKESVGQNVFFLFHIRLYLFTERFQFGLEIVCRTAGDRFSSPIIFLTNSGLIGAGA
jgi:hypothetical protein